MNVLTLSQADWQRNNEREFIFIGCTPFNCSDPDEDSEDDETFTYASKCELLPGLWDIDAKIELTKIENIYY